MSKEGLGVSQVFSDDKNLAIILTKYQSEPDLTMRQTTFLCLCWNRSIQHRARAKYYLEFLKSFTRSPKDIQQQALEKAKRILKGEQVKLSPY